MNGFLLSNYVAIMTAIAKLCEENEAQWEDVILELDFFSRDHHTPAPASKGEFKVDTISRYTCGSRPAKPDWTNDIDNMLDSVAKAHRVTPRFTVLMRNADAVASLICPSAGHISSAALRFFPLTDEKVERLKQFLGYDEGSCHQIHRQHLLYNFQEMVVNEYSDMGGPREWAKNLAEASIRGLHGARHQGV